jgi:hypothetical protein
MPRLRGGGDISLDGQIGEIFPHVVLSHLCGVFLPMEDYEPLNLIDISLFGFEA